jgi:hypothetical protein
MKEILVTHSSDSSTRIPPKCSLVSANGPSVMDRSALARLKRVTLRSRCNRPRSRMLSSSRSLWSVRLRVDINHTLVPQLQRDNNFATNGPVRRTNARYQTVNGEPSVSVRFPLPYCSNEPMHGRPFRDYVLPYPDAWIRSWNATH